jgi:hypothetical protein
MNQRDHAAVDRVYNVANAIDRQIGAHVAALQTMAASPLLDDPPRLNELYRATQGFHLNIGGHIIL